MNRAGNHLLWGSELKEQHDHRRLTVSQAYSQGSCVLARGRGTVQALGGRREAQDQSLANKHFVHIG